MGGAMALRMGLAGYDSGAACRVAKNAGGKGQPIIMKEMVQQEWGEIGEGGEEERNNGRCNNDGDDNDKTAVAISLLAPGQG
jgi:hypothetical protein